MSELSPQDEAAIAENTRRMHEQVPEMKATPWDWDTYRAQYDALMERAKAMLVDIEARDAELDVLRGELQRRADALHEIMRQASYLPRGCVERTTIERIASDAVRAARGVILPEPPEPQK